MSALAGLDLLALTALLGALCALRPGCALGCRLVALALAPAAGLAWLAAHSPWLARAGVWALVLLAMAGLANAVAAWRRPQVR